jgi:hypothetical protein
MLNGTPTWAMADQAKSISLERLNHRMALSVTPDEAGAIREALRVLIDVSPYLT